ncbi:MAG: ABC transporter permease subunit [Candidatus Poribacteria bacterium]|nr:ABC transporter permease subunit [Candidatus Poribacteria bacterium]
MLKTLIRRELLDNLMTFRFAAAVFITLLLVVANTIVLLKDYEQRLTAYNTAVQESHETLREEKTYSGYSGTLVVHRPPNPLSIFNLGLDKQVGNKIEVYHAFVPTIWDAEKHGADNPFLNLFTSIDIVLVFQGVLSLLALIFAYDALAGERERGTLRLVLTHPIQRGYILFAKYISAMLCLLVPLLMSLLLSIILLTTSTTVALRADDFLRIGGIILTSLLYVSLFYLIGLCISAMTRRTSTALMLCMFVWGVLVLVYPNLILTAVDIVPQPETQVSVYNQIKQMWEKLDREKKQFIRNDAVLGPPSRGGEDMDSGFGLEGVEYTFWQGEDKPSILLYFHQTGLYAGKIKAASEPQVPHVQDYYDFYNRETINTVQRTWLVRKPALEAIYVKPANLGRMLLRFSPGGLYDAATEAWAGSDLEGIQDFFSTVQRYRRAVVDYFYDQKIFESRQWFAADKGTADWDTLPQFSFQRSDTGINAKRALPDMLLLLTMNVILFTVIMLIFIKSEV